MSKKISYIEASKTSWRGAFDDNVNFPGIEYINMASLQRIAAATEAMAINHIKLQDGYDYMRKSRDSYQREVQELRNKVRALKGVITRMKRKKS